MKSFSDLNLRSLLNFKKVLELQYKTGRCLVITIVCHVCQRTDIGIFDNVGDFKESLKKWDACEMCNSHYTLEFRSIGFSDIEMEAVIFTLENEKVCEWYQKGDNRKLANFH